jgi:hypothetical protein
MNLQISVFCLPLQFLTAAALPLEVIISIAIHSCEAQCLLKIGSS